MSRDNNPSESAMKRAEQAREFHSHAQKKGIKRFYAKKFRAEYIERKKTENKIKAKIATKIKEVIAVKRTAVLVSLGTIALIFIPIIAMGSCGAVAADGMSTVMAGSYQSSPKEIDAADLQMTELEMKLQDEIDTIEEEHPGYDEYEYNLDPIEHDPFALASYLSAKYTDYTASQVEGDVQDIFDQMYTLTTEEREETRTRTVTKTDQRPVIDEDTGKITGYEDYEYEDEEEYTVSILSITLKAKDMDTITSPGLSSEQKEMRDTLMGTKGLLQYYYTPLDLNWQSCIKSYYGYRKNPKTGDLEFNKGVDISVPEDTPVYAAQTGHVTESAFDDHYGNYVVIKDDKDYASKYANMSRVTVSAGQGVNHGEVIGYTGHTGSATGSELHIECEYQGESYNPLFYFENGEGSLYPTNADTGEYIPVEATGDAAALIHEAMNYLDYPYVWGGSTPETSFDCSGFVSWCLNNSGYADVGRQTAQGLCNISSRVSADDAQPGDLIFFTGTYKSSGPVSHVGIYLGNGQMIHAGDPIKISNINTPYWQSHFYQYGRL